mgnify:CR=1 FL=1
MISYKDAVLKEVLKRVDEKGNDIREEIIDVSAMDEKALNDYIDFLDKNERFDAENLGFKAYNVGLSFDDTTITVIYFGKAPVKEEIPTPLIGLKSPGYCNYMNARFPV